MIALALGLAMAMQAALQPPSSVHRGIPPLTKEQSTQVCGYADSGCYPFYYGYLAIPPPCHHLRTSPFTCVEVKPKKHRVRKSK